MESLLYREFLRESTLAVSRDVEKGRYTVKSVISKEYWSKFSKIMSNIENGMVAPPFRSVSNDLRIYGKMKETFEILD